MRRENLKNCFGASESNAKQWNRAGGVFDIYPGESGRAMEVYCDVITDEGGWIVSIQAPHSSVPFSFNLLRSANDK